MNDVLLDAPLTWQSVAAVAAGAHVSLSGAARERMAHARAIVEAIVARGLRCYGVNTGVGALCDVLVGLPLFLMPKQTVGNAKNYRAVFR